jgi:hypothetical protein
MVNDTEPRYRLVDPNGNVVGSLFAESDGTLKLQEGTSGNDNELSLTTQGALEVEQVSRASQTVDRHWTELQSVSLSSSQPAVSVTNIADFPEYKLEINDLVSDTTTDIAIRFNGDGASSGDYYWWDETGAAQNQQDEIVLATTSQTFRNFGGHLIIDDLDSSGIAVDNRIGLIQPNGVSGFAQRGGNPILQDFTELELFVKSGNLTGALDATLLGRVD